MPTLIGLCYLTLATLVGGIPVPSVCAYTAFSTRARPVKIQRLPCFEIASVNRQHERLSPRAVSARANSQLRARNSQQQWEGDDIRWITKFRRNFGFRSGDLQRHPARNSLILVISFLYTYQVVNTVSWMRHRYRKYWPASAASMILDVLVGNARPGPLTMDLVHSSQLSSVQPHRFLTGGFLHGSIFHLLINADALRRLPGWIETGLGPPLYLTTFLASVVAGNVAHSYTTLDGYTLCLGASGGICGLYGLMYVCLVRMGNHAAAWRVIKGMGILFLYGLAASNVSNAGHLGGFVAGLAVGLVAGPSYRRSYALRRKNSLEVDTFSRDYRTAMGFDKVPSIRGWIPLPFLWLTSFIVIISKPELRSLPFIVWQSLLHPGVTSVAVL
jgi:membrane associated rhomboid family serine protease